MNTCPIVMTSAKMHVHIKSPHRTDQILALYHPALTAAYLAFEKDHPRVQEGFSARRRFRILIVFLPFYTFFFSFLPPLGKVPTLKLATLFTESPMICIKELKSMQKKCEGDKKKKKKAAICIRPST